MRFKKSLLIAATLTLAACGDLTTEMERAKQGAVDLGQEALKAGADIIDTRSACLLAGQSASFCTCLSDRLGPEITPEHVEALTAMVRATLEGDGVQSAAETVEGVDARSREAVVQCATRAAVEGAVTDGGN